MTQFQVYFDWSFVIKRFGGFLILRNNKSCLGYRDEISVWDGNPGQLVYWLELSSHSASPLAEVAAHDNGFLLQGRPLSEVATPDFSSTGRGSNPVQSCGLCGLGSMTWDNEWMDRQLETPWPACRKQKLVGMGKVEGKTRQSRKIWGVISKFERLSRWGVYRVKVRIRMVLTKKKLSCFENMWCSLRK